MLVLISSRLDNSEKDELLIYSWLEDDKIISKRHRETGAEIVIQTGMSSPNRLQSPESSPSILAKRSEKAKQSKAEQTLVCIRPRPPSAGGRG